MVYSYTLRISCSLSIITLNRLNHLIDKAADRFKVWDFLPTVGTKPIDFALSNMA
jgi:hypothetical protein